MTTVTVIKTCVLMRKKQTSGFLQGQMFSMACILTTNLPWWQVCTYSVHMWSQTGRTLRVENVTLSLHNVKASGMIKCFPEHTISTVLICSFKASNWNYTPACTHTLRPQCILLNWINYPNLSNIPKNSDVTRKTVKFGTVLPFKLGVT